MRKLLFVCAMGMIATGCNSNKLFQEKYDFEDQVWLEETLPEFSVEISDASQAYDIFYSVRHTQDYPFQNLYVQLRLADTTGGLLKSELQNVLLFDPKSGEPFGSGLGSLITRNVRGVKGYQFPEAGTYVFQFEQRNRSEATAGIDSFGIWVEPSN